MKKLLLIILTPVVLIAGAATAMYFLIRDTSSPSYVSNGKSTETILNDKVFDAFAETKNSHDISLSVTQDDFNQVLVQTIGSLDETTKQYVKGMEMKIDGETYHLNVYLNASIVSTKIDLSCKFSKDDDNFYLMIEDIKMGSLSNLKGISLSILKNYMSNETFNSMFFSAGLPMSANLDQGKFTISKEDIHNLILDYLKDEDNKLPYAFLKDMFALNYFNTTFENELNVALSLEDFHSNETFYNATNELSDDELDLENNKTKLITLLNENKIDLEHKEVVYNFLTLGYDYLKDEDKSYIDSVDMTSIGYTNESKKLHFGYTPISPNFSTLFKTNTSTIFSSEGFLLNESYINQYIQYRDLIGYTYLMDKETSTGYEINYITIDNFYVDFLKKDDKEMMNMTVGLNINGYETSIILENEKSETITYGMKLKNQNIYFGNYVLGDEMKDEIYKLLNENLSEDSYITFDGEGTFTLSFEKDLKSILSSLSNTSLLTSIVGENNIDTNAGIRIKGSISI